ncbi:hypothetical protein [Spiroplasma endosymbiont of Aspidapion aeneum]|uniref:hypothetical protein n=1 Tax=Spiroplasma endosymbiont of Aspidapion aeneum TaxID=3066276 RepID=UPI00313F0B5F
MKKLLSLLCLISLPFSSSMSITSCFGTSSPKKDKSVLDGEVNFEHSEYNIVKGAAASVVVTNFSKLSADGFTKACSIYSDDDSVAQYINLNKDGIQNYQTIQISGIKAGHTKVSVSFTNVNDLVIKKGSFDVNVVDFSTYQPKIDTKPISIDLSDSDSDVEVGSLPNYDDFKKFNFTDFTVSLTKKDGDNNVDPNNFLTGGYLDGNGDIYFKIDYSNFKPKTTKESIKIAAANIVLKNTAAKYVSNAFPLKFSDVKLNKQIIIDPPANTPIDLKNSVDLGLSFGDGQKFSADDIKKYSPKIGVTFSGSGGNEFKFTSQINENNDKPNLHIEFIPPKNSYGEGKIDVSIIFTANAFTYSGFLSVKYKSYNVQPSGFTHIYTENGYTSVYSDKKFNDWNESNPIDNNVKVTSSADLAELKKDGFSYKDTIVFDSSSNASEWAKVEKLDLTKETDVETFKNYDAQKTIDNITKFTINDISFDSDNNLHLNIKALSKQIDDGGVIYLVSRFTNSLGNYCAASATFSYAQSKPVHKNLIITPGKIDGQNNTGETFSNSIHLNNDSSEQFSDSYQVQSANDTNVDLSNISVTSSAPTIISVEQSLEQKNGKWYIKMRLIGQKSTDVASGKVTISLNDGSGAGSTNVDIFYGTFIGADASVGDYSINNQKTQGSANYYVASSASSRAVSISYSASYGVQNAPNLEFADKYSYSGSNSPFVFKDKSNELGNVTFDGNVNVTGRGVISVTYDNIISGKILFNGDINYTGINDNNAESCGVISEYYTSNSGIKNSTRIAVDEGVQIKGNVNIIPSSNMGAGIGFINTIKSGAIGQVNAEKNVIIDATNVKLTTSEVIYAGIIYSNSNCKDNDYNIQSLAGLDIKGDAKINGTWETLNGYMEQHAIIYNIDEFYAPKSKLQFEGNTGLFRDDAPIDGILYSEYNTSDKSSIFAIGEIDINNLPPDKYGNISAMYILAVVASGSGYVQNFNIKANGKQANIDGGVFSYEHVYRYQDLK